MSKFMDPPGSVSGRILLRGRSELLDELLDLRLVRGVRIELQIALVRGDGDRRLARGLRGLRELEPRVRVVRPELRKLLPRLDDTVVRELRPLLQVADRALRARRRRLLDRVRPD